MSPEKLESLRKLAADERTPIEEARNAALQFVRHGGAAIVASVTLADVKRLADVAMVREAFGPELDALKQAEKEKRVKLQETIDAIDKDRESIRREREAYKKQLEDIRAHGKAILAFVQGEPEKAVEKPAEKAPVRNPWDWDNVTFPFPKVVVTKP